jgi:hypothetical protein
VLYARAGGLVRKEKVTKTNFPAFLQIIIFPAIFPWRHIYVQIRAALQNPDHNGLQKLGDYLMLYLLAKNLSPLILKVKSFFILIIKMNTFRISLFSLT